MPWRILEIMPWTIFVLINAKERERIRADLFESQNQALKYAKRLKAVYLLSYRQKMIVNNRFK